jgi:hypothetical protein
MTDLAFDELCPHLSWKFGLRQLDHTLDKPISHRRIVEDVDIAYTSDLDHASLQSTPKGQLVQVL